ncbi:malto-oligosyltrehalose trehalohydrolase [Desulfallas thermosapovorans]|uniref:Malto-oligosyltrehalose trehalohydrolase n=1 Tax=Desulfallas thermosapovorans DSM 6562 TaxID=1121431 RepID=A0A5S4ZVF1_9FIRM|nr:malto-oligosyltrehalose trehalohydrolase [Desulfallas thermosapovorans]TYO96933.1 maltooligosyltrehalose trehalohydrolase [Desulfallas thermosapovorans DSM 6562]
MFKMGANIINREKSAVSFRVFAHNRRKVSVVVKAGDKKTEIPMVEETPHVYSTTIEGMGLELLYKFKLDDEQEYPDPYSCYQPLGVHGFSQLVDHEKYRWRDGLWQGRNLNELVIMEIHVGTFSATGTFTGVAEKLDYLVELGVGAIELMPVTQTPGRWNWGYDGVNLFSVNHNYGTPGDLKRLVDLCHQKNLAVILDVVYNHFGPEGNYLPLYGPYFTGKHETPWGKAVNFDDLYSEYTRKMVLDSVRYWLEVYHFDGLRLDAVHAIKDSSPIHILQEISLVAKNIATKQNREKFIIAESDENNARLITPLDQGGLGMDAQWMDDFHHCIHTVLTGEREGYYMDYGRVKDLEKVYKNYLYTGQFSKFWGKPRGTDGSARPGRQFLVAIQNHDQVGNRARGDRLATLVEFPYLKAAAGLLFFSAYLPMIFMGEEYGEKNPFLFFTDYQDPVLQRAVSRGRKKEFAGFTWENVPDPQDPRSFYKSKLTPNNRWEKQQQKLFNFYRDLIALRTSHPVLKNLDKNNLQVEVDDNSRVVKITRWNRNIKLTGMFNLGTGDVVIQDVPGREIINSLCPSYGGENETKEGVLRPGQVVIWESAGTIPGTVSN